MLFPELRIMTQADGVGNPENSEIKPTLGILIMTWPLSDCES